VSDHGDAPDPRTDIADLYAFAAPGNDRSVLVLNINSGASAPEARFDPAASYELKIDTDGDLEADVAFHVLFASSPGGGGAATVYRSAGAAARGTGPIGDVVIADAPVPEGGEIRVVAADGYRFCAGLRSDPFFFDGAGLRNSFRFTGTDAFADRNVFAIVLEVPNAALGTAGPSASGRGPWPRCTAGWSRSTRQGAPVPTSSSTGPRRSDGPMPGRGETVDRPATAQRDAPATCPTTRTAGALRGYRPASTAGPRSAERTRPATTIDPRPLSPFPTSR
jgi:hypothetical protein